MSWWPAALWPALLLWPPLRDAIESRMLLHMLLEFPLLLLAGWAALRLLERRWPAGAAAWQALDWRGLSSSVLLLAVSAFWMIPAALDAALLSVGMAAAKYLGWWLTGAALASAWPRQDTTLALFTWGNLAWMTASAGLLYQSSPQRLCVSYLQDEQAWTGGGLVALALLLGVAACLRLAQPSWPYTTQAASSASSGPKNS